MPKEQSNLIKFLVRAFKVAAIVLPAHSNRFSKRDFTQPQLMALAALKQRTDEDYRDTLDSVSSDMMEALGLLKIPHFTTLQKFIKRLGKKMIDILISMMVLHIMGTSIKGAQVAIDSSGYPCSHASSYYVKRIRRKATHKTYLKGSFAADMVDQLIICGKIRNFPAHDSRDFIPVLEKAQGIIKKIACVFADKGYDGDANIAYVRNGLDATPYIKLREGEKNQPKSTIRKESQEQWNALDFTLKGRMRNLIETINSVIKRVFGDELYSRNIWMRRKELQIKYFSYNIYRSIVMENDIFCFVIILPQ